MLVVSRFEVPAGTDPGAFANRVEAALGALADRPGFLRGRAGRSTDDPGLWLLSTEWESVGAYRRALGGFEVKMHATPLVAEAVDEPSAFEVLLAQDAGQAVRRSESNRDFGPGPGADR